MHPAPVFPRPVVVVSRCLEIDACRYNGGIIRMPFMRRLLEYVELLPVCPEVEIGLGTPRAPIRLVARGSTRQVVQPATGRDITAAMDAFAEKYLGSLGEVDGFILKSRSPSCGIGDTKIFDDLESDEPLPQRGAGVFGAAVLARYPEWAVEDDARLADPDLRHRFLVKLFSRAAARLGTSAGTPRAPYPRELAGTADDYRPGTGSPTTDPATRARKRHQ